MEGLIDTLGQPVGCLDGLIEGDAVGKADGDALGLAEGTALGLSDGD